MPFRTILLACALFVFIGGAPCASAQPGGGPAKVNVAEITRGTISPTADFKGTVYFKEVAELATEVPGQVEAVEFEEGQHLEAGALMLRLDDALLRAEMTAAQAAQDQAAALLAQEQARLERAKVLLADEVTTPQQYDDIRYTVESLGHQLGEAKAEVRRLQIEIEKKVTTAPFNGVVVDRLSELGEWKNAGETVAVYARDDAFDVIVNLPEANLPHVHPGATVEMTVAGEAMTGKIVTVIPRGDVTLRTFPVKLQVEADWLLEGMTADVRMPVGEVRETLLVPRDAVFLQNGEQVMYIIREGTALRTPVEILGYTQTHVGVAVDGVESGVQVVVKGQERLNAGQPVEIL